ncbi:hypothetical protein [Lutibacter sp.]|uniref:hypothetical protein n=1 Tax=Lutibacter sp. TaxID=1925666 RepID=UPI0025BCC7A1|nr:hypothetical protein [Lutibacter sp.]MCF6182301.1 hypothetical protein [Lutibacter sp.]
MKTKLFLIITLISFTKLISQQEKRIAVKDSVEITYQLLLKGHSSKKDKYILIVNAINKSNTDKFYTAPMAKSAREGHVTATQSGDSGFTRIKVRNSTGLFGNGASIKGEFTDLITTDNEAIYVIRKGDIYTQETSFRVLRGDIPLITNTFTKIFEDLSRYDLRLTPKMINGDYVSNCGNIRLNLNTSKDETGRDIVIQTINGKQFIWIRRSEDTFVRKNNCNEATLTFNKTTNSFQYSTVDGVYCDWVKD